MTSVLAPILEVDALAADGSIVRLRAMTAADTAAVRDLHVSVSGRNLYLRFFSESRGAAQLYAARLAEREPDRGQVVLLAEQDGRLVGVASFEPLGPGEAEVAFLLDDLHHGLGIGTLLLEHLAAAARSRGISRFRAEILAENGAMLRVFADSGFARSATAGGPVTAVVLETELTGMTVRQILRREQQAEDLSLASLLAPRTIAVVGSGLAANSGEEQLAELRAGGFVGALVAVNTAMASADGPGTYPSISAVPGRVDLAILTVPSTQVASLVEECGLAGVRSVLITAVSPGVGGSLGIAARHGLVTTARRYGTRVVGPGSLGVLNTAPGVALNASPAVLAPRSGGLSMAVQSGAVGRAVCDHADRTGVGLAEFVSLGEKADVSGNDLLLRWWREPRTRVIGLCLDSFGNPLKFARISSLVSPGKPILVVLGDEGRADPDPVAAAVFAQSGVVQLDSVPDLLDVARVLSDQPLPAGRRLAIVGNSAGLANLATVAASASGLTVAARSTATQEKLGDAVRVLLAAGEVDAILVNLSASRLAEAVAALAQVCAAAAANPGIPILAACVGVRDVPGLFTEHGIRLPVFEFPELAVRALGHAAGYAAWRRRARGTVPTLAGADVAGARDAVRTYLTKHPEGGALPAADAGKVLHLLGVEMVANGTAGPSISMTRDPRFGPLIGLVPAGGAAGERVLRGLPLSDVDASAMISARVDGTAAAGSPSFDPGRHADELDVLHRVALLAERIPEIAELTLHATWSRPVGAAVGDVLLRVANVAAIPDPLLSRLS